MAESLIPSETPGQDFDVAVTRKEQTHFTVSFSAYSMSEGEACEKAINAADWFKHTGYEYLKDLNVVVVSVSNISDRTTQIVDDYEWRYGFDVRFRAARGVAKRLEPINEYNLQGTMGTA